MTSLGSSGARRSQWPSEQTPLAYFASVPDANNRQPEGRTPTSGPFFFLLSIFIFHFKTRPNASIGGAYRSIVFFHYRNRATAAADAAAAAVCCMLYAMLNNAIAFDARFSVTRAQPTTMCCWRQFVLLNYISGKCEWCDSERLQIYWKTATKPFTTKLKWDWIDIYDDADKIGLSCRRSQWYEIYIGRMHITEPNRLLTDK